jgi:cytochrome c peroxidase
MRKHSGLASRFATAVIGATCALLPLVGHPDGSADAKVFFTEAEINTILSHGPWPLRQPKDPSNRASGNPEAADFGMRLFFDQRLSGTGEISCARCHVADHSWTDSLRRGSGMAEVERNTPTLMNLHAQRWFGWDGSADSLWSQNLRPIVDKRELGATPRHVARLVREDQQFSCRYGKTFGTAPSPTNDESVFVDVGKALAAFVETLVSGHTPFDRFRDALARGQKLAPGEYSEPAQRGLKIFIGKGGCTGCHSGPNFTGGEFFNTGLTNGKNDAGRFAAIRQVASSRFNLMGPYNDDRTGASAEHTRRVALEKPDYGAVKVPTLRNLVLTGPYGRDGSIDTLADVVRHYSGIDPVRLRAKDGAPAQPLNLTQREQADLVVFLESLSTFSNGWRPEHEVRCQ